MDIQEAARFLDALDSSDASYTFQTFDDDKSRKDSNLLSVLNGTLEEHAGELCRLNAAGAGVFVTVNETDLRGRKGSNIVRVRAAFVDLDGSPLEPVLDHAAKPHIVVESSEGRWHAYYKVQNFPLSLFTPVQNLLIKQFSADPKVNDLPRVMRLPGFLHQKDRRHPYLSKVLQINEREPYTPDDFDVKAEEEKKAVESAAKSDANRLNDAAFAQLDKWVPQLFPKAVKKANGTWRVSSQDLGRNLEEDISITSTGIKDFGVHDLGDKRDGKRTPMDLAAQFLNTTLEGGKKWLSDVLGYGGVSADDFWAYMPGHTYIYAPTGEHWPGISIDRRLYPVPVFHPDGTPKMKLNKKGEETDKQETINPSIWLDRNKPVEQMIWAPGEASVIPGKLANNGGWVERSGVTTFNLYKPPLIISGVASQAQRWIDHVHAVYPEDAKHIISYFAHRVQRPADKINHCLVLGGSPGIGKDSLLEPLKQAVGPWNWNEIVPSTLLGSFNGFVKSVVLRISEARDLEVNRYQFYEHSKIYMASPPDVFRCNEKHINEHSVFNVCGVIITTNYKTNGIYLPPDDRRHYVAWSEKTQESFDDEYWNGLWGWYKDGGFQHVAAYLRELDISHFDPKAPPLKTAAFWAIVDANRSPEDSELAQLVEELGNPPAVTVEMLLDRAQGAFRDWLADRKNRRVIPHRFEQCDYVAVRNAGAKDGLWKIGSRRVVVYAQRRLNERDRITAAQKLTDRGYEAYAEHVRIDDIPFS